MDATTVPCGRGSWFFSARCTGNPEKQAAYCVWVRCGLLVVSWFFLFQSMRESGVYVRPPDGRCFYAARPRAAGVDNLHENVNAN